MIYWLKVNQYTQFLRLSRPKATDASLFQISYTSTAACVNHRRANFYIFWNVWGLKRKLTDIEFINYLKKFDVVFLGEIKVKKNDLINYAIECYCCDHVSASKSLGTTKTGTVAVSQFITSQY